MNRILPVVVAIGLGASVGVSAYEDVDLPIQRVVLFSSGVGYFQHHGDVEGDAAATFLFKTDQINDVLKSMVVMDYGEGNVNSIRYPSREPLERALRSFAVDISEDPDLAELLTQLRGAEVTVDAPEPITGKILGIETHKRIVPEAATELVLEEAVLNLVTDEGIKSVPLRSVGQLRMLDERLDRELRQALELLIGSQDTERKPVTVRFTGQGRREVTVGYIAEAPVWKASYRLVLAEAEPRLQGWAIVENTSDSDWKDVQLALVSGRPISFIQDLYTPLYAPRPVVEPELYASLKPRLHEEGMRARAEAGVAAAERMKRPVEAPAPMPAGRPAAQAEAFGAAKLGLSLDKGVQSVAAAEEAGELFRFTIEQPIDLPRHRSAMLPIVNSPMQAEKVSVYNASVLAKHPLNGAYLTNDTALKLPAGPITVFDEDMYAGDARLDNMVPQEKRLISYAVDLNVTVDPSQQSSSRIASGRIDRGMLHIRHRRVYTQTYAIHNKSDQPREMVIEHPFHPSRKLLEPNEYEEKTPQVYRFRLGVDAEATKEFDVKTEQVHMETIAIFDGNLRSLLQYTKQGEISEKVRDALAKAVEIRRQIAELEEKLDQLEHQKRQIEEGQGRLRQNLQTVGAQTSLGRRYLQKLNEQEDQIEQLTGQIEEVRKQFESKRTELREYLEGLNLD